MSRTIPESVRRRALREKGPDCNFCDSNEKVEVHHIDGDASNHGLDNLIPACRSCHMKIHYPRTPEFEEWNDKILPRDERKTGDELTGGPAPSYDETFRCVECGHTMPSYTIVENCPECDSYHSLELDN